MSTGMEEQKSKSDGMFLSHLFFFLKKRLFLAKKSTAQPQKKEERKFFSKILSRLTIFIYL
jgi:hypothetical protein